MARAKDAFPIEPPIEPMLSKLAAEIDREARKGKPVPSDHAPLLIDVDEPGVPFDAGWSGGDERTAARRGRA